MRGVKFAQGIPRWAALGAGDPFHWLLATTAWEPTLAIDVVRDDIALFEPTDPSYSPQPVTSGAGTPTAGNEAIVYTADEPTFPLLDGGDALGWLVLAEDTGLPATDLLLAAYPIIRVANGTDLRIIFVGVLSTFPAGPST